jgi:hypothetical protein
MVSQEIRRVRKDEFMDAHTYKGVIEQSSISTKVLANSILEAGDNPCFDGPKETAQHGG